MFWLKILGIFIFVALISISIYLYIRDRLRFQVMKNRTQKLNYDKRTVNKKINW